MQYLVYKLLRISKSYIYPSNNLFQIITDPSIYYYKTSYKISKYFNSNTIY